VPAHHLDPVGPPLVPGAFRGTVALEREADQQLGATQAGPLGSGGIQRGRQVVGLGHEVARAGRRHDPECITVDERCYT
jgi:hypothetical protein